MTRNDDWFRQPALSECSKDLFETKLSRSRSSRHEYMRIQAGSLQEAGVYDEAILLIDRIIMESPDIYCLTWLLESRAGCHRSQGRQHEALADFRASVQRMRDRPSVGGNAPLEFGFWIATDRLSAHYQEAMDVLLEFWDPKPLFPLAAFRQHAALALVANGLEEAEAAEANARAALAWAARQESNAANHRDLGLVRNQYNALRKQLRNIARLETVAESVLGQISYWIKGK